MTYSNFEYTATIYELGVENQILISRCLDNGLIAEAKELTLVDFELKQLLFYKSNFDFVSEISQGQTLLVGEGNLSFTLSLTSEPIILATRLTSTTIQTSDELSALAEDNADKLRLKGVKLQHGIDATKLDSYFPTGKFDNIIFQFPHTGSRSPIYGQNPNHILIRKFLKSAKVCLSRNGKVLISAVDNPHYRGAFQFEKAAEYAGFQSPEVYSFNPNQFPGYVHTMTNEDDTAIEKHKEFSTWVFRL